MTWTTDSSAWDVQLREPDDRHRLAQCTDGISFLSCLPLFTNVARLKSAEIEPLILITIGGLAINKLSPRLALELYPNNILCQILTQFWSKEAPPLPSTVLNHMADYHSQIHTMSVSDSCHPQLIRQRRRGKGHNYLNKKTQKTISRVMWQGLPTSYRHQMIQCLSYCVGEWYQGASWKFELIVSIWHHLHAWYTWGI